ncbi:hypothetical protein M8C21_014337 [Ambrosia artemisiifolia]|uniref:Uncharacterized protein n=1 Tax=Ambrosia artemisiifolia TaxID=4212 RepID=A0AAD5DDE3_AMBAR|nr:hypothetical protein M8C21_014337 [Ambrosia artemisiifolia]
MFLEPFVLIKPYGLKMVGLVTSIIGQMASQEILKGERKKAACYRAGPVLAFPSLDLGCNIQINSLEVT